MSTTPSAGRDERTVAVENAGYRWAGFFLSFGLFIDWNYRVIVRHEDAWDLAALLFAGAAIVTVYQARHKTLGRAHGRMMIGMLIGVVAMVIIMAAVKVWSRS